MLYLDWQMQSYFRNHRPAQSAQLYARAPNLTAGSGISLRKVASVLQYRGYRRVTRLSLPGQFVFRNQTLDLYPNPVPGNGSDPEPVRLIFQDERLQSIARHRDGVRLERIVLEPELIGTLQLGPFEDRIPLRLHEMPNFLSQALLIMEDRDFAHHSGVDLTAITRAFFINLIRGETVQGGSTITQQLVKNLFLTPERSWSRKIAEALMAITLELRYSKNEILEHYMNSIFLGQSGNRAVHGFALASEYYFARPLHRLGPHEIATLVGIIPAPSTYNPRRHPERARDRRNLVLTQLADAGLIKQDTASELAKLPLTLAPHRSAGGSVFPAYVDYLHRQLRQYYPEDVLHTQGVRLYTTLDADIQQTIQSIVARALGQIETDHEIPSGSLQGAAVVVSVDSGDILALVGGRQAGYAGFNRAIDAQRPIGSLIKPLVYLTALERPKQFMLGSVLQDKPLTLRNPHNGTPWSPQNYDRKFHGPVTLLEALAHSYNVPAVRVGMKLGLGAVTDTVRRLGIRKEIPPYPSTLLGASEHSPLEIAQAYQSIANGGIGFPLRSLSHISDRHEKVLARFPGRASRTIPPGPAYLIDYALKEVVRTGTASRITQQLPPSLGLAGKTGTTDNYRDSWFVGYSGNLLTVVWMGRDDNRPVGLTGAAGAMRIWAEIMQSLHLTPSSTQPPAGVKFLSIDPVTGRRVRNHCARRIRVPVMAQSGIRQYASCDDQTGQP